jgi:predicted transcriptional regulator of viral defense system
MSVVGLIAPVAEKQHALAHLRQLRELGVSRSELEHAIGRGELERRLPEVYRIPGSPRTWHQDLMASVLDGGPGSAASHRAAARLLGLARRDAPAFVEITVPRLRSSRIPGVIVHRSKDLDAEHVMEVEGIPCTGPLRTLVDLGAVERWPVVSDAFERALQSGQATMRGAEWMLTDLSRRGRRGCGVFRRVLDTRALSSASPDEGLLEPRMARLLRGAGLPDPSYQYEVVHDGRFVARVDFAYPDIREAFEVDGFEVHGTPEAMTRDFEREHGLKGAGWGVTRFTWFHVVTRPRYVESTVRSVLGAHNLR